MSDELMELPESWVWVKTGDVCEGVVPGRTKPKSFSGTIPWITLPDITGLYLSESQSNLAVTKEDAEEVGMRVMPKGTVLMSCVGQFGLICIAETEVVPNQQLHGFICLDKVLPEYVAYALMTQVEQMNQLASATTIAYINKTKCNSIQIPLAPINEQKRIVAAIASLRDRSQKARSALSTIPELCDKFRQSVLAAAFRGDLTADWREQNPDVEPASVLLGELDDVLPATWFSASVGNVIEGLKYGTSQKCGYEIEGTPVLRIPNVSNGIIDHADLKYAELPQKELEELKLFPGDILIIRSNGSVSLVGKSAVVRETEKGFAYAGYLIRLRLNQSLINPYYLHLCLSSRNLRLQIEVPARSTSGVHNINSQEVRKLRIALPPLMEQKEIAYKIDILLKAISQLEQQYKEAEIYLDSLDRSILAKAFRGELVEQNPNDEPASVLLDRVRAEREQQAQGKAKKPGKKGQRTIKAE